MIEAITTQGFRGIEDRTIEIGEKTLIVGPNGSGKTSLIYAAQLAREGYIPGQDKRTQMIHARGDSMTVGEKVNGHDIRRTWKKAKKGSVTQSANIDGMAVKAAGVDDALTLLGIPHVVDIEAFWGLSDRLRRQKALELAASAEDVEAVIDGEEKARTALNNIRNERRNAEQTVERLAGKLAQMDRPAGDMQKIDADIAEAEKTARNLRTQVDQAASIAKRRKACMDAIAAREQIRADMAQKQKDAELLKTRNSDLAAITESLHAEVAQYAEANHESLPGHACDVIRQACDDLEPHREIVGGVIDNLTALLTVPADQGVDLKKIAEQIRQAESEMRGIPAKISRLRESYGILRRKLTESEQAEKELAELPEPTDANAQKAIDGIESRIAELRKGRNALVAYNAIAEEAEDARIVRDKMVADEEAAKEQVAAAVQAQSELADASFSILVERGNGLLPYGSMEIVNDETTFALAWNTGERVALRDSLCGYERVIFDGAVARAVGGNDATVFIDGGEVSNVNLSKACEHIGQHDSGQVVITRWTDEGTNLVPTDDSWTWVTL